MSKPSFPDLQIRPLRPEDDAALADVITRCLAEFGAGGPGFVTGDPDFAKLHHSYSQPGSAYFVAVRDGALLGGAGVAHLKNAPADLCEFQKMYLLPAARGLGLGQKLLELCLDKARELGYRRVYLETLLSMTAARALYERNGFKPVAAPLGGTGHFGCDAWYLLNLDRNP